MKIKYLFLILTLAIVFFSCKKQGAKPTAATNGLPPATQTGANEVAWLTDSVPYISQASQMCSLNDDTVKTDPHPNTGTFQIQTPWVDNGGYHRSLSLFSTGLISFPIQAGTVLTIGNSCTLYVHENIDPATNLATQLEIPGYTGKMVVTYFDPVKKIISGTFNFETEPFVTASAHTINGWFDIVYSSD